MYTKIMWILPFQSYAANWKKSAAHFRIAYEIRLQICSFSFIAKGKILCVLYSTILFDIGSFFIHSKFWHRIFPNKQKKTPPLCIFSNKCSIMTILYEFARKVSFNNCVEVWFLKTFVRNSTQHFFKKIQNHLGIWLPQYSQISQQL